MATAPYFGNYCSGLLISPSPGLNFHPGFFIPLSNSFFAIIFFIHFRASNHSIYSSKQKELY